MHQNINKKKFVQSIIQVQSQTINKSYLCLLYFYLLQFPLVISFDWIFIKEFLKCSYKQKNFIIIIMEQEKYAIFLDDSGSVCGFKNYWKVVGDILEEYGNKIDHYYLWHHDTRRSSREEFAAAIAGMRGGGGNEAWKVAEEVVRKMHSNIILITDGEIMDYDVQKCDETLEKAKQEGFQIRKAICYTIGNRDEPNLSVTCAFTRYGESRVFSKGGDKPLRTVMQYTKEDFKILEEFAEISLENFQANFEKIEQLIIAKNMGRDSNPQMKNQLVHMKTRLIKEYSKEQGKKEPISKMIRKALRSNEEEAAFDLVRKMANNYFTDVTITDLEKKLTSLIALCGDLRGQYSLGQIRSNKMTTATRAEEGKIDLSLENEDLSKNPIECPIIMDEDVPQILIDSCDPFLLGLEKALVDDINACPLRILNYPHLKAKFKARLSNYTGVKYCDKLKRNPFTRGQLLGAIPLGSHRSHVVVGNSTIAKMVAGGKVMGNLDLYFAVVWVLVMENEIEYLSPIKANLTEHLIHRLTTSQTMASLCGLPKFVSTQINTDIALWFCLSSGQLNTPTERDAFRFHLFDLEHMRKLVDALGYPLHEGFTRHYLRTRALYHFLDKLKYSTPNQKKALKTLFRGLYQRGFLVNTTHLSPKFKELEVCSEFIPVDGVADEAQVEQVIKRMPKFCSGLTKEDLLYVLSLLDEEKLFSDIFLDYNAVLPPLPQSEVNWKFGLSQLPNPVQIHPKTLRPLSEVDGVAWKDNAKAVFGVESEADLFKGCKYFEEFVLKHKKRPTFDELAVFYYNRYIEAGKKSTLPFLTATWIKDILEKYNAVFPQETSIKEVIATLKQSRNVEKRKFIEHSI